jgi:hypothetical protein
VIAGENLLGAIAVQIVSSSRRGSRSIEHLGSAHDDEELEALKAAGAQRLAGVLQGTPPGTADHYWPVDRRGRVPVDGASIRGRQGRDRHHAAGSSTPPNRAHQLTDVTVVADTGM